MGYLTVTGRYPFESTQNPNDIVSTLQNISSQPYRPLPPYISMPCADLIARMLDRDPGSRLTLEKIAEHEWSRKRQHRQQQVPQINGHYANTEPPRTPAPDTEVTGLSSHAERHSASSYCASRGDAPARDETASTEDLLKDDDGTTSCFAA